MIDEWIALIRRTVPVKRGLLGSKDNRGDMDAIREQAAKMRKLCSQLRDVLVAHSLREETDMLLDVEVVRLCLSKDHLTRADLIECRAIAERTDLATLPFETCDSESLNSIVQLRSRRTSSSYSETSPDIHPGECFLRFKKTATLLRLTVGACGDVVSVEIMRSQPSNQGCSYGATPPCMVNPDSVGRETETVTPSPQLPSKETASCAKPAVREPPNASLDTFFEDVREEQWQYQYVPNPADETAFYPVYNVTASIEKSRRSQQRLAEQSKRLLAVLEEERATRPGLLDGICRADELVKIPGIVLDRNVYYVNSQNFDDVYVAGDLHGSEKAFRAVLEKTSFIQRMAQPEPRVILILLGDYVDRGAESLWVLYHAIKLKALYPRNVVLLKGNHEDYTLSEKNVLKAPVDPRNLETFLFGSLEGARVGTHIPALRDKASNLSDALPSSVKAEVEASERLYNSPLLEEVFGSLLSNLPVAVAVSGGTNVFLSHGGIPGPTRDLSFDDLKACAFDYYAMQGSQGAAADRYPSLRFLGDLNQDAALKAMVWNGAARAKEAAKAGVWHRYEESGGGRRKGCLYSYQNFASKFGFDTIILGHDHPATGMDTIDLGMGKKAVVVFSGGGFDDAGGTFRSAVPRILKLTEERLGIESLELIAQST